MTSEQQSVRQHSCLGTGWSFPPTFRDGVVAMTQDEEDIQASLHIVFSTACGERFLQPNYGLDMQEVLFKPMSTTLRTFLIDRVTTTILIHEPRIRVIELRIDSPDPHDGTLRILLEYEVRATNSRFKSASHQIVSGGNGWSAYAEICTPLLS